MRVYISGPITGNPDFLTKFKTAQELLESKGHCVINPAELSSVMPDADWDEYIDICKVLLMHADALYQLDGWGNSRESRSESVGAV